MATAPCAIGRTIQRPAPMWAMMDGAIPANRFRSRSAAAQERGCRRDPARRARSLPEAAGCPRRIPALRDARPRLHRHQRIQENLAWPTLETIPRESMSANWTAAGSRSVAIHRMTSSTKPVERPITVSITPSPRTLWTEAPAAAALPADLGGLEGVIHSLLLSALEKILDRMDRASLRSDGQSRRPLAIAETDSSIEPSARSPAEPRETMLRVGALELDLINRTAKRGDRPIDLRPSEFRLLKYVMQQSGKLLTRAKLFQDVCNTNSYLKQTLSMCTWVDCVASSTDQMKPR